MLNDPRVRERFWSKVAGMTGDGCWEWTAGRGTGGYGMFAISHRSTVGAHRMPWAFAYGPIPPGKFVCVACTKDRYRRSRNGKGGLA